MPVYSLVLLCVSIPINMEEKKEYAYLLYILTNCFPEYFYQFIILPVTREYLVEWSEAGKMVFAPSGNELYGTYSKNILKMLKPLASGSSLFGAFI